MNTDDLPLMDNKDRTIEDFSREEVRWALESVYKVKLVKDSMRIMRRAYGRFGQQYPVVVFDKDTRV